MLGSNNILVYVPLLPSMASNPLTCPQGRCIVYLLWYSRWQAICTQSGKCIREQRLHQGVSFGQHQVPQASEPTGYASSTRVCPSGSTRGSLIPWIMRKRFTQPRMKSNDK
jgi:hypothetical protein